MVHNAPTILGHPARRPLRRHSRPKPSASHTSLLPTSLAPLAPSLSAPKSRQHGPHHPRHRCHCTSDATYLCTAAAVPASSPATLPLFAYLGSIMVRDNGPPHHKLSQTSYHTTTAARIPCLLLSQGTHHPTLHFRPAWDRCAEWLGSRRQREQQEQWRERPAGGDPRSHQAPSPSPSPSLLSRVRSRRRQALPRCAVCPQASWTCCLCMFLVRLVLSFAAIASTCVFPRDLVARGVDMSIFDISGKTPRPTTTYRTPAG